MTQRGDSATKEHVLNVRDCFEIDGCYPVDGVANDITVIAHESFKLLNAAAEQRIRAGRNFADDGWTMPAALEVALKAFQDGQFEALRVDFDERDFADAVSLKIRIETRDRNLLRRNNVRFHPVRRNERALSGLAGYVDLPRTRDFAETIGIGNDRVGGI